MRAPGGGGGLPSSGRARRIEGPTDPARVRPDPVVTAREGHAGPEADAVELAERQQVDARLVEGDDLAEQRFARRGRGWRTLVLVV